MKVGEKYVIEIDKIFLTRETEYGKTELAKIKGFNSLVFDENGLSKLEKLEDVIKEECDRARADEIKVGDEVKDSYYDNGAKGVVTRKKDGKVYIVWSDGSYGWRKKESPEIEKTGKQYPCIAEVMEQLNNE